MNKISNQDGMTILGYFYPRIGNAIINAIKYRLNEDSLLPMRNSTVKFCAHNELRNNITFYPYKQQNKYTFENIRDYKSIIHYINTNRNINPFKI